MSKVEDHICNLSFKTGQNLTPNLILKQPHPPFPEGEKKHVNLNEVQ